MEEGEAQGLGWALRAPGGWRPLCSREGPEWARAPASRTEVPSTVTRPPPPQLALHRLRGTPRCQGGLVASTPAAA